MRGTFVRGLNHDARAAQLQSVSWSGSCLAQLSACFPDPKSIEGEDLGEAIFVAIRHTSQLLDVTGKFTSCWAASYSASLFRSPMSPGPAGSSNSLGTGRQAAEGALRRHRLADAQKGGGPWTNTTSQRSPITMTTTTSVTVLARLGAEKVRQLAEVLSKCYHLIAIQSLDIRSPTSKLYIPAWLLQSVAVAVPSWARAASLWSCED